MTNIKWLLISQLHSAFYMLGEFCGWDLSDGEVARLTESFYSGFEKLPYGFPTKKREVKSMFADAKVAVWGEDHECDPTTEDELYLLMTSLSDEYRVAISAHPDVFRLPLRDYCRKTLAIGCIALSEKAIERQRELLKGRCAHAGLKVVD